jgi:hypothetical protein
MKDTCIVYLISIPYFSLPIAAGTYQLVSRSGEALILWMDKSAPSYSSS